MTSRARILALLGLSAACIWSLLSEERTAGVERVTDANTSRERRKAEATQALHRQRLVERQDENGRIAPDAMHRALAARRENLAAQARQPSFTAGGIEAGSWRWAGPDNVGGRCRSLYVHRTNPDRLVLGAVGGGIWLSDDAGVTWRPCDDLLGSLVISSLTADAGDPDIVYAGTGEAFGSASWVSIGVLRSRDGGLTWSQLGTANNPNFTTVNSLSAHPMRPGHLLVASYTGVWRSTDYGESWTRTLAGTSWRVTHHSTQGDSCVATQYGKIFWSRTGGRTWTEASVAPAATGSRVEVAWAKDRWTLYASAGYRDNDAYVYKSTDGGQTFRNVYRGNLFGKQGNYDNAIWVDPLDSNRVMVGGIGLYRSLDGGRTFRDINHGKMHVDFHAVVPDADYGVGGNRKVYVLNDAGVHWTEDIWKASVPGDWHNAYKGLGITQFFGGDVTRTGIVYGGTQDRGSTRRRTTLGFEHNALYGADGGECVADPDVSGLLYGEGQYAGVFRSRDDGRTFGVQITRQDAPDGMKDAGDSSTAPFIAPLVMDPDRPQRLWVGATSLWRTDDARVDKPTWRAARGPSPEGFVTAIGVTPGRSRTVFVGYGNGNLFRSDNATSLSPTWRRVDAAPLPNRAILKILVSPRDPDRVYVSLGGYQNDNLYSSSDGGQTWSSISGMGSLRLPPSPIRGLVVHPDMPRWIYVGTEVGVYVSTDHGDSWTTDNQGPANVAVEELVLKGGTLWAFTHGRGIFHANAAPVRSGFEDVVRASVDVVGTEGNRKSVTATLSQNGRHVAFESDASNLVPGDSGGVRDIFVRDRQAKTIRRVSESARRRGGNQVSRVACMARSGRYVAFESLATNLIPNDSNLMVDVFVKDLQTDAIERVSAIGADDDPDLEANGNSQTPSITPGGRIVVFSSYATNLVAGDRNKKRDVFLRDRAKRTVERISVSSSQGEGSGTSWNTRRAVSGDGRFVVFTSDSPDLVVGDRNGVADVFLRDRIDGSTKRISMTAGGNEADGVSQYACISDNGGFVVFESFARLDPGDSNNLSDVYLYDRATDKVRLISTPDGRGAANGASRSPTVSPRGQFIAFHSAATDLVAGDTNARADLFVVRRQNHRVRRVLTSRGRQPDEDVVLADLAESARYVAFHSRSEDMVANDTNDVEDVFVARGPGNETVFPLAATTVEGDAATTLPFSTSRLRMQWVARESYGRGALIRQIAFRRDGAEPTMPAAIARTVEIELAAAQGGVDRLSTRFDSNYDVAPTTVVHRRALRLPDWRSKPNGVAGFDAVIPFDQPHTHSSRGTLLMELRVHANSNTSPRSWLADGTAGYIRKVSTSRSLGLGCPSGRGAFFHTGVYGSNGPSSSLTVNATRAPANQSVSILLGTWNPATRLPGACELLFTNAAAVATLGRASASGDLRVRLDGPAWTRGLLGQRIYTQLAAIDAGQSVPLRLSNGLEMTLPREAPGPAIRSVYAYFPSGTVGTVIDSGPVFRIAD